MSTRPIRIGRLTDALYAWPELRDDLTQIIQESRTDPSGTVIPTPSAKRLKRALENRGIAAEVILRIISAARRPTLTEAVVAEGVDVVEAGTKMM